MTQRALGFEGSAAPRRRRFPWDFAFSAAWAGAWCGWRHTHSVCPQFSSILLRARAVGRRTQARAGGEWDPPPSLVCVARGDGGRARAPRPRDAPVPRQSAARRREGGAAAARGGARGRARRLVPGADVDNSAEARLAHRRDRGAAARALGGSGEFRSQASLKMPHGRGCPLRQGANDATRAITCATCSVVRPAAGANSGVWRKCGGGERKTQKRLLSPERASVGGRPLRGAAQRWGA